MIFPLLKVLFRNHLGRLRGSRRRVRSALTLFGLAGLPILIVLQTHEMFKMWLQIPAFGVEFMQRFLSFSFLGLLLLLLFTGFSSALHHFYLATDLQLLLPLPLSSRTVFTVKFFEVSFNALATFVAFGLPLLISMAWAFDAGWRAVLLIPAALFFVMIAAGLSSLVSMALVRLFNVTRLRRAAVFILGIFIVLGWAGLQFLRMERFNPVSLDFDLEAAASFSQTMSSIHSKVLPSDWLINAGFCATDDDWRGWLVNSLLLAVGAAATVWLATTLRTRLTATFEGGLTGRRTRRHNFGFLHLPITLLLKEFRLVFRDMRMAQGYMLFSAILLVWPFLQEQAAAMSMETFGPFSAYLTPMLIAVTAANGMARQSVPIERRSFQYVRTAPTAMRQTLLAKVAVHILLMSVVICISVFITAWRIETTLVQTVLIQSALWAFIVLGAAVGLFCGARFGDFGWTDPRHMLSIGWNFLSLLFGWIVVGIGAAILAAGYAAGRLTLAFVIFFVYVFTLFWASILLSEKRLTRFDWL